MEAPQVLKPSRLRKAVATAMAVSATMPQFTLERRADVTALLALRRDMDGVFGLEDAIVAAAGRALRRHPRLNASWMDGGIAEHPRVCVAAAVGLLDGVVAPAVADTDTLTLPQVAAERRRLVAAAREGGLTSADLSSATFTVSNLGAFGVERFQALVTPPQAAVLAVGAVTDGAVWLALSVDHRVTDGMPAAAFLADVVVALEKPEGLLTPA